MLTSVACVLPGVFLLLRGVALLSDAMSHTMLFGIVGMFLITHQINSPLLFVGAASVAWVTVMITERLMACCRMRKDAAVGLVFPFFFSLGILLVSQYARQVHLDVDMVMLGELAFAPFYRLFINGVDCGPQAVWALLVILSINTIFITLFFKELVALSFDGVWATVSGTSSRYVVYGLMFVACVSAVGAFNIVGSIVVVALMIVPCACGYLLAKNAKNMLLISSAIGAISSFVGCGFALLTDVSLAGSIAMATGFMFILVFLGAPKQGMISRVWAQRCAKRKARALVLCSIIREHSHACQDKMLLEKLRLKLVAEPEFMHIGLPDAIEAGYVHMEDSTVYLTQLAKNELLFAKYN